MKFKKSNIITIIFIILAIIFTILVRVVDVKAEGANGTSIGFSTINKAFFNFTGENKILYSITKFFALIPFLFVMLYGITGLMQLVKRKSVFKVDKELLALGGLYVIVIALYAFFEKVIINYRPILIDGEIEASYPSSHTLMTICICGSAIIINNKLFRNKGGKIVNIVAIISILVMTIGRLFSGVHWLTDIIGGIIISSALLLSYYSIISSFDNKNVDNN